MLRPVCVAGFCFPPANGVLSRGPGVNRSVRSTVPSLRANSDAKGKNIHVPVASQPITKPLLFRCHLISSDGFPTGKVNTDHAGPSSGPAGSKLGLYDFPSPGVFRGRYFARNQAKIMIVLRSVNLPENPTGMLCHTLPKDNKPRLCAEHATRLLSKCFDLAVRRDAMNAVRASSITRWL